MLERLFADLSLKMSYVLTRTKSLEKQKLQVKVIVLVDLFVFPLNYILGVCMGTGLGRGDLEASSIF